MEHQTKHEFSLYWFSLSSLFSQLAIGSSLIIDDDSIVHRITRVLRLGMQEHCIIFDRLYHIRVALTASTKKNITLTILEMHYNTVFAPSITVVLPVLKREALREALYISCEYGAQTIQLVHTEKSARLRDNNELKRLDQILIAAAEQSKNFAFPLIKEPRSLQELLETLNYSSSTFFLDSSGSSIAQTIESIARSVRNEVIMIIGPEGDLTIAEKKLIKQYPIYIAALTPTILRAQQAVASTLTIFRTFW